MSRQWWSIFGVPVIAVATFLFAAQPLTAQRGGGGGHGGGGGGHGGGGGAHPSSSGGHWTGGGNWSGNGGSWHGGGFGDGRGHGRHDRDFFGGFGFYSPDWYWGPGWYDDFYGYGGTSFYGPDPSYSAAVAYQPREMANQDPAQSTPPPGYDPTIASVFVHVPANAELWFGNQKMTQTGEFRQFQTPSLDPDEDYSYEIRARWTKDGKTVDVKRKLVVRAGDRFGVDLMNSRRK